MILFVITKIVAIILAVYIVRKVRFTRMHSKMFGLSLLAGIGFTSLAVSPLVLNVPKVLMTVSIDLGNTVPCHCGHTLLRPSQGCKTI